MVVDDSRAIRLILSRTLTELGYDVSEASNGAEALRALDRTGDGMSLILVDWNMPEMNGLEFVKRVRADDRFTQIKLMMVTTETQPDQMIAAIEAGANEYVMKPFTADIIKDKLRLIEEIQ